MIIANGTIEIKIKSAGGINPETGYPVASVSSWGEAIPCQYIPTKANLLARSVQGDNYVETHYTILISQSDKINAEQIRLSDKSHVIGEYSIISIEQLDAVLQTKITV